MVAAGDWYEERRPGLALKFAADVGRALDVIGEAPFTWALWPGVRRDVKVRRFLLSAFPFAVAYVVQRDRVVVLAVAHTRRRPDYWIKRIKR